MNFSIGEEIKKRVKEKGITNVAFAEKMNIDERNLYHFFKKKDIPLDQLVEASYILDFDFIKHYLLHATNKEKLFPDYLQESTPEYIKNEKVKNEISFSVKIFGELEKIQHEFPSFLSAIKKEAEMRG